MQAVESYRENPFLLWDVHPMRPLDDAGQGDFVGPPHVVVNTVTDSGYTHITRTINGEEDARLMLSPGVALNSDAFTNNLLDLSSATYGSTLVVVSGFRSQARQNSLISSGNPRAARVSQHTVGSAADVYSLNFSQGNLAQIAVSSGIFNRVNLYTSTNTIHVDQMSGVSGYYGVDWVRQGN